jgi:hypothetical protein
LHETEFNAVIVWVLDSVMTGTHVGVAVGLGVPGVAVGLGLAVALGVGLGQPTVETVKVTLHPPVIVPTSAPRSSTT